MTNRCSNHFAPYGKSNSSPINADPTPTTIGIAATAVEQIIFMNVNIPTAIAAVTMVLIKFLFQRYINFQFSIVSYNPTGCKAAGACLPLLLPSFSIRSWLNQIV